MKTRLKRSPQFRLVLASLYLLPLITLLHAAFSVELEMWRLPLASWVRSFLSGVPFLLLMRYLIVKDSFLAKPVWNLLSLGFAGAVFWRAFVAEKVMLAFFGLLWVAIAYIWAIRFHREKSRSYMSSGLKWYESQPVEIPHLSVEFNGGRYRVARLDQEGVFVFGGEMDSIAEFRTKTGPAEVTIRQESSGMSVNVLGEIAQEVHPRRGALNSEGHRLYGLGVRFVDPSVDRRKVLGDFVEKLRGEGHVA